MPRPGVDDLAGRPQIAPRPLYGLMTWLRQLLLTCLSLLYIFLMTNIDFQRVINTCTVEPVSLQVETWPELNWGTSLVIWNKRWLFLQRRGRRSFRWVKSKCKAGVHWTSFTLNTYHVTSHHFISWDIKLVQLYYYYRFFCLYTSLLMFRYKWTRQWDCKQ